MIKVIALRVENGAIFIEHEQSTRIVYFYFNPDLVGATDIGSLRDQLPFYSFPRTTLILDSGS
jgi:hypothetical protein